MVMILDLVEPDMAIVSTHVMLEGDVIIRQVRLLCDINLSCTRRMIYSDRYVYISKFSYHDRIFL